jgi:branched-chain amino acid transport system substrate-binding protein
MFRFKGFIAIAICLIMVLALVACGSSTPSDKEATTSDNGDANAGRTIKIGLPVSLSGNYVGHGEDVIRGATTAVEEINSAGGILGHKVELVTGDIENQEPSTVTTVVKRLITRDKVDVITGGMINPSLVEIEIVEEYQIPYIASSYAQAQERLFKSKPGAYHFVHNTVPSYAKYQTEFPEFIQKTIDQGKFKPENKKVAVVMSQNEYSLFCGEGMRDTFKKMGWEIVVDEIIPYQRFTEFEPILAKIRKESPSIILYTDHTATNAATFLTSFLQEPTPSLVFLQATPSYAEFREIMAGKQDGVFWDYASSLVGPKAEEYIEKYTKRWGSPPNPYGGYLYDCVYIIADAMTKAGDPFDKIKINEVLLDPNYSFEGIIGKYQFDENRLAISGDDNIPFCIFQEENDKHRVVSPEFLVKDDGFRLPHWYEAALKK